MSTTSSITILIKKFVVSILGITVAQYTYSFTVASYEIEKREFEAEIFAKSLEDVKEVNKSNLDSEDSINIESTEEVLRDNFFNVLKRRIESLNQKENNS